MLSLLLLQGLFSSLVHCSGQPWVVGQAVGTTSGLAKGRKSPTYPEVSEYLGIRFGQDTSAQNRFMPPKPYSGTGTMNATSFHILHIPYFDQAQCDLSRACPQVAPPGPPGAFPIPAVTSEDCLFINVWSKPQSGETRKAVVLYIFGGAFIGGDASASISNGAGLANNEDVIVVAPNYRVNVFGFPSAPGLTQKNPGLLDQRLAVEWTKKNIAAFGGDPDRITIYGGSAGGSSVDYYAYAWTKDPIVNGLIASSGTAMMTGPFSLTRPGDSNDGWYKLSASLGCGGAEAGERTIACAQTKSMKEIQAAIPIPSGTGVSMITGMFGPMVDNQTIFSDYYERAKAGNFIQRPMLVGSNHNESLLFTTLGNITDPKAATSLENGFNCGAAEAAKARSLLDVPVWRYHFANNPPNSTLGALHGMDVMYVFGDGVEGVSKLLQSSWATFVRDPKKGLSKIGWPKYDPKGNTLVRLAYNSVPVADFVPATMYDGTCPTSQI
ncbi:alpha/beta-hydrolase [Eremomyces bilateralis CBS 781.70]|uniref:Carboxylic ester hydrolase n=1 Tax=Eremomyces bilateralis CBS 781.70 TaxID=1392243 RepID=A0A6G1FPW9_9PEZI|nr:alpha/beta-hydrolase [Eremomyces bilateralis CBS 781.70]KAF1807813.1 alpha/beta-hydrolase [Eremomyces bilateralis CBS 781.70]